MNHKKPRILLLPGDGIGPEVIAEARRVLDYLADKALFHASIEEGLIGGAAWQEQGVPLHKDTLERAKAVDAVLLGAVGAPRFDTLPRDVRPEAGLLQIRKELDLFANLRPILCFSALSSASTLREEVISGLDIVIVRELSSGVYFGEPRGPSLRDGKRVCVDTQFYSEEEVVRIARVGFELARQRRGLLHSVDKANVMETGFFWRGIVSDLHKKDYPDVTLHHMYADNCAMQLVRDPKQFDVMVTDNLFGDILSDCGAMLTGSLGMLPSASLGATKEDGSRRALYEPVHGSAPDIAGENKANPLAMLLSLAMMLRLSFSHDRLATCLEKSVDACLAQGWRTPDIAAEGTKPVSTSDMTNKVLSQFDLQLQSADLEA